MNYHVGPGIQPSFIPPEKPGYYGASAAFPPGYAVGLPQRGAHQTGAGMNGIGQHPSAAFRPPASSYGLPVPYSSVTSYPALSSAAYGAGLPSTMSSNPAGYPTIGQPGVLPSRGSVGISQPSSQAVSYQVSPSANYSQPTYLSNPDPQLYSQQMGMSVPSTMGMPMPTPMNVPSSMGMSMPSAPSAMSMPSSMGMPMPSPMSVPTSMGMPNAPSQMYATAPHYPGNYASVPVQPPHPSYSSIGYSGLPATRGVNPSFPGAMGYPGYPYK